MGEFLKTVVGIALVLGVIWWLWQGVLGTVGIIAYLLRGGGLTCFGAGPAHHLRLEHRVASSDAVLDRRSAYTDVGRGTARSRANGAVVIPLTYMLGREFTVWDHIG